jgi:hypothetical protein
MYQGRCKIDSILGKKIRQDGSSQYQNFGGFFSLDPLRILQYQTLVASNYGSLKRN